MGVNIKFENERKYISNNLTEHFNEAEKLGYNIVLLALQGSQNYNLAYENSDIDTKCLIIPSFRNIARASSPVSKTHVRENNEHIDIKDIRLYFRQFWKQNINFLEILFTPYLICTSNFSQYWKELTSMREDIAHFNMIAAVKSMSGMAMEKFKIMKHPYPTVEDKIEKYGYDGKQLHHILRIEEFLKAYINGESFAKCLVNYPKYGRDFLLLVKRNEFGLEAAEELAQESINLINEMKNKFIESASTSVNVKVKERAEEILYDILAYYIKQELED